MIKTMYPKAILRQSHPFECDVVGRWKPNLSNVQCQHEIGFVSTREVGANRASETDSRSYLWTMTLDLIALRSTV